MPFPGSQAALTSTSEDGPPEGAWILASLFPASPHPQLGAYSNRAAVSLEDSPGDFPGSESGGEDSRFPMQRVWVQSLVRELRLHSHMPRGVTKKTQYFLIGKKKKLEKNLEIYFKKRLAQSPQWP